MHATLAVAGDVGVSVVALHVHHGLSPHADAWVAHCRRQCAAWAAGGWPVEFQVQRLADLPSRGDSIEAWARRMRYRALGQMARDQGASLVLLAHHRRDQAETLLLQALRGAGPAGLAGMPGQVHRDGLTWLRPWLNQTRQHIDDYVQLHTLAHVEDDSNSDPRFDRNRLRLSVWPALLAAFPQAEAALAASAAWAAEAAENLDELAQSDLGACATGALRLDAWLALSPARRSNSLRRWLKQQTGKAAPASLVLRLLTELPQCSSGARWPFGDGELRCHHQLLRFAALPSSLMRPARETRLQVRRAGWRALPGWGGRLQFIRVEQGGVPLAWLGELELKARLGAELFQAGPERPCRSLKKQFQAAGVPAWAREGPLIYSGGQLVYVPGLGIDARAVGLPGQRLMGLRWLPDTPA